MQLEDIKGKLIDTNGQFTLAEANELVSSIYDERFIIETKDRFHGQFFHEICPLLTFANQLGDEVTHIQFTGAHSRFDGILILKDGEKQTVEMTAAIDGRNDALQMELLSKRRHAPAFQKIEATGTKRNREFGKNELKTFKSDDYDRKTLLPLLNEAFYKKCSKANSNPGYSGAWLGIVFDDYIQSIEDRKKLRFDPLCRTVLDTNALHLCPFRRVFFVGVSRQYVYDSDTSIAGDIVAFK